MARFLKKRDHVHGRSPGSLVFIGKMKVAQPLIRVIDYGKDTFTELERLHFRDIPDKDRSDTTRWISVYGLHDTELVGEIGAEFNIHPLILEDILNTGHRPKLEEHENFIFLIISIVRFNEEDESINSDQLSLLIGSDYLLSFQEKPVDLFKTLRDRLKKPTGRLRDHGTGYLAYAILDTVVDHYMATIEALGSRIEDLEEEVLQDPTTGLLDRITTYKREVTFLRKTIRPAGELVTLMKKLDTDLILESVEPYLKDLEDHIIHAREALDTYRDLLSDQLNIYHSSVSLRLNDIMRVLTIFAAIFIPLTLIAGIYGTNFEYFPELHYKYSYFIFWLVLIGVAGIMFRIFKKKGWF